jgi:predicted acyltransferase
MSAQEKNSSDQRIASIDQLRGYAIFGMILVNYLGSFHGMHEVFKHHRAFADWPPFGFSYADTIAPLFVFVVGIGFRLSFRRNAEILGMARARRASVKRYCLLIIIGYFVYGMEFLWVWDALVDIGFAGLLALPFIHRGVKVQLVVAVGYLILFQFIYLSTGFWNLWTHCLGSLPNLGVWVRWPDMDVYTTYGEWLMDKSIDGGPFGPLSWVFSLFLGSVAYDMMQLQDQKRKVLQCLGWGIGLFTLGWIFRLEWGTIKSAWYHSQYAMTIPYIVSSTGLAFLMLLGFHYFSDIRKINFKPFTILGKNALVIYIFQQLLLGFGGTWGSPESSVLVALFSFTLFMTTCYGVAWGLHQRNIIVKL